MPVEVENHWFDHQVGQPRLFLGFLQRHRSQVGVAVGVPAQLQPAAQLAVVGQQHPLPGRVHQPGRTGEMTGQTAPFVDRAGVGQQGLKQRHHRRFRRVAPAVVGQGGGQVEIRGHETRMRWKRATSVPTAPRPLG